MTMHADELVHTIKQIVSQAMIEQRPCMYGHVSDYNSANHTLRVIVPALRDDLTGAPLHSGWLPFGSPFVGAGSGIQVVPQGGATTNNPTAGELALVVMNERGTGVASVACLFYTARQQPPNTGLSSSTKLKPGEMLIQQASGSFVRLSANGDISVQTAGDGAVNVLTNGAGNISLTTSGKGTVAMKSANPVTIDSPSVQCTGEIFANFGGQDQVSLSQHKGHTANGPAPPTPGT